jgi:hypothetical protein
VMYDLRVATMTCSGICQKADLEEELGQHTVNAIASARAMNDTTTEDIFHASLTDLLSCLSGQKRSKKKPDPNIVATAIPTKILYDAMPTKSSL